MAAGQSFFRVTAQFAALGMARSPVPHQQPAAQGHVAGERHAGHGSLGLSDHTAPGVGEKKGARGRVSS